MSNLIKELSQVRAIKRFVHLGFALRRSFIAPSQASNASKHPNTKSRIANHRLTIQHVFIEIHKSKQLSQLRATYQGNMHKLIKRMAYHVGKVRKVNLILVLCCIGCQVQSSSIRQTITSLL